MNEIWDARYAEPGYAYGERPNDFLAEVAERLPEGPVLCLGEGEGRNSVFLAERGHEVHALDSSVVGLDKARRLAEKRGVSIETIHADLASYVFDEDRWAAVVSIFCHLPPPLRERVHRAVSRALTPGGMVVLEGYTPEQLAFETGGPRTKELLYELAMLREDFADLEILHARELQREVREGRLHTGIGAVVQVLARKAVE